MLERIHAFRRTLQDQAAERLVPLRFGTGLFCDSLPDVYDLNYVRAETSATAGEIGDAVDRAMESFFHRKVTLEESETETAGRLAEAGWERTAHLVMVRQREPDRRVAAQAVREVAFAEIEPLRTTLICSEPWGSPQIAASLNQGRLRIARAVPLRYFGVFDGAAPVGYCELREAAGVAQIEDVNTLASVRGRGLGRALVQAVADEARSRNDIVFLEALADDWPRHLYDKVGFDVVATRHQLLRRPHALTRLRLRTPRLELRLATVAELRLLAEVARGGIHAPEEMPFKIPWTDRANDPGFEDEFVRFHRGALDDWQVDSWALNLVAFVDGAPVGSQALESDRFGKTLTVGTGSWLGRSWQGLGLGTEMRAAVLQFAFGTLGARTARSGALAGNAQSLGVSRKLGYAEVGVSRVSLRGVPIAHQDLELAGVGFRSPVPVEIEGAEQLLGLFGARGLTGG